MLRIDPAGKRSLKADASGELLYICVQAEKGSLSGHTMQDGFLVDDKPSWS